MYLTVQMAALSEDTARAASAAASKMRPPPSGVDCAQLGDRGIVRFRLKGQKLTCDPGENSV
jgi:hypothetical protein